MDDKYWNELDELGQKMSSLTRLLDRAKEYGDGQEMQRINAQIACVEQQREKILVEIAELSVAA